MGQTLLISLSKNSTVWSNGPSGGKTIIYSALHCGQETLVVELPACFSSIQRCRQTWWTHFVVPRQRQGLTHCEWGSSSSVAKQTQQRLQHKNSKTCQSPGSQKSWRIQKAHPHTNTREQVGYCSGESTWTCFHECGLGSNPEFGSYVGWVVTGSCLCSKCFALGFLSWHKHFEQGFSRDDTK